MRFSGSKVAIYGGRRLSGEQMCFLSAVYHVELLLRDRGAFDRIYCYRSRLNSSDLAPWIPRLASRLIQQYPLCYRHHAALSGKINCKDILTRHFKRILLYYPHSVRDISKMVLENAKQLFSAFFFLLWDKASVELVVDMLGMLETALEHEKQRKVLF